MDAQSDRRASDGWIEKEMNDRRWMMDGQINNRLMNEWTGGWMDER